ncbi:MAG: nucleoside hydrolase [Cyanobacteria bacterium P01_G01_bin.39]
MSQRLVLMDHDGAVDDFLSLILLMTMKEVKPLGIVVTPADCYINAAVNVTRKILDLIGSSQVSVAASTVRGINPFPADFRRDCTIIDNFPLLNESESIATPLAAVPGDKFIVQQLNQAARPVTLMVTGPLTTVASAIASEPTIIDQIESIVWMGGALSVAGNVEKVYALEHDGSAEWNVFWDPVAAKQIWDTNIPVTLCPLDLTNNVPVTPDFIRQLSKQRRYPLSDLAGLCYSLAIPQNYYFWDILATTYLARPELYQVEVCSTEIITTGISQGRTILKPGGRKIKVMTKVDQEKFCNYLLQQFALDLGY